MAFPLRVELPWGYAEADQGPGNSVRLGDRLLPRKIQVQFIGADDQPALTMRLEVIDDQPQCRELRVISKEGGRQVKQLDLRAIQLTTWVEEVFGMFAWRIIEDREGVIHSVMETSGPALMESVRAVRQSRKGKSARTVTPKLLARVAEVYRAHLSGAPTRAVGEAFGVGPRMAAEYVSRARRAGLLPPTTPGKKKG